MHSCSNDGMIELGPLSSDVMFEVIEISGACFYTFSWGNRQSRLTASSLDPADQSLQTASRPNHPFFHNELDKCLSSRENGVLMTSNLRHYY